MLHIISILRFLVSLGNSVLHWSSFSGLLDGQEYRNQEREKQFEYLAPNMTKARKDHASPPDDINSHREDLQVC